MFIDNELELHEALMGAPVDIEVRTSQKLAKKFLQENKALICGGMIFHLNIRPLGLGVYAISKADLKQRETVLIKKKK